MSDTLISALAWVRKGYASSNPKEYDLLDEEIDIMKQDPSLQQEIKKAQQIQKKADKEKKKGNKNLNDDDEQQEEDWDEEEYKDGDEFDDGLPVFTSEFGKMKKGVKEYDDDGYKFAVDDMSEADKEDYQIRGTDGILVAAKIEKEFSSLEVYVYEQEKSNLFVHHEVTLSAFPLALEWLPINPNTFQENKVDKGNYIIVGTFLPEIEIWNLDVLNAIEPSVILGGEIDQSQQPQQKTKKGKKVKQFHQQQLFKEGSHTDSVLSLSLNPFKQNILLSGSADQTVKIWDIQQQKNLHTFKQHTNKVQLVEWNQKQEAVMLSGGFDKQVVIQDVRQPQNALTATLSAEIESGGWVPYDENLLYASQENGQVSILDARKFDNSKKSNHYIANFFAHQKQTTSVSFNTQVPGMMATTSMDKSVKIFDMQQVDKLAPKLITQRNPNAGGLFCGSFYQDSAWVFGCGNSMGEVFVWDTAENKGIVETFGSRVSNEQKPDINECTKGEPQYNKRMVDEEDDSDEDDKLYEEGGMDQE